MSAPIKVTDLVQKSLETLDKANQAEGEEAVRLERRAHIYEGLAGAQSAKTANIIAYLNSDRSTWSPTDEEVVRIMLGLHTLSDESDGGIDSEDEVDEPVAPTPAAAEPEPESEPEDIPTPVAVPVASYDAEPSFA